MQLTWRRMNEIYSEIKPGAAAIYVRCSSQFFPFTLAKYSDYYSLEAYRR